MNDIGVGMDINLVQVYDVCCKDVTDKWSVNDSLRLHATQFFDDIQTPLNTHCFDRRHSSSTVVR